MASASSLNDENHSFKSKSETKDLQAHKQKAFVPAELPADFLRVYLDQEQLNEDSDSLLAQQLHYDLNKQNFMPQNQIYRHVNQPDYGRGRLQMDIVEAKLNKNYGIVRMDPYVRIKLGNKVFETPTAPSGSKNPIWRKTIFCNLPHNVDTIAIEVFDEKSFTEDDLIAFVKFPLPNSLFDGLFIDEWIPLSGKLGEQKEGYINIQMLFTGLEDLQARHSASSTSRQSIVSKSTSASASSSSSTSPNLRNSSIIQPNSVNLPPEQVSSLNAINDLASTEGDFKSIKEMFPTFDEEVIRSVIESSNGNKEMAIELLLQMATDA